MNDRRDAIHTLVVTEIDAEAEEWEMEVIHPDGCPMCKLYDAPPGEDGSGIPFGPVMDYDCPTGREIRYVGFESFPDPAEIGAGEHKFRIWWSGPDRDGEYDGGVDFEVYA